MKAKPEWKPRFSGFDSRSEEEIPSIRDGRRHNLQGSVNDELTESIFLPAFILIFAQVSYRWQIVFNIKIQISIL
jgi:hypothetical protein